MLSTNFFLFHENILKISKKPSLNSSPFKNYSHLLKISKTFSKFFKASPNSFNLTKLSPNFRTFSKFLDLDLTQIFQTFSNLRKELF